MNAKIVYVCSGGLGENLQASPVMRRLKKTYHVVALCHETTAQILHEDCYHERLVYTNSRTLDWHIAVLLAEPNPAIWTYHLKPPETICKKLECSLVQKRRGWPTHQAVPVTRRFWWQVIGSDPKLENPDDLRLLASPPTRTSNNNWDVLVSTGSQEKMRRLPDSVAATICNSLQTRGLRTILHSYDPRPVGLHHEVGFEFNNWSLDSLRRIKELVHGVKLVIGPDSGANYLALAYGKNAVFLESRAGYADYVDSIYAERTINYRMERPDCRCDCSARRKDFNRWPVVAKGYPHNLECASENDVPCLRIPSNEIDELLSHPLVLSARVPS